VVDLMLSFAIPDGLGPVMDPAVGGGTFLVRAYERIRTLHPELTHQELLAQLFGVDISAFPATLAAINLAAKRLEFEDNYPRIVAKSFFEIAPRSTFMAVPTSIDLGNREQQPVPIEEVRAIVCNPPYVRRQQLAEDQLREAVRSLHRTTGRAIPPTEIGGLSNYHLYFWFHAGQFLSDDGTLAFITAGEWMDSDYGAALQLWLLENFQVEIVIESLAEPWFSEARVGTVVTIARLCRDLEERVENRVRFITLRVPLRRLYGSQPETTRDYFTRVDRLRDRMMALGEGHGESDDLDWSVVRQGDLLTLGAAP
jgi:type I restriction-modification system DNA methylase subunit